MKLIIQEKDEQGNEEVLISEITQEQKELLNSILGIIDLESPTKENILKIFIYEKEEKYFVRMHQP